MIHDFKIKQDTSISEFFFANQHFRVNLEDVLSFYDVQQLILVAPVLYS
jgi:hypothetical protein